MARLSHNPVDPIPWRDVLRAPPPDAPTVANLIRYGASEFDRASLAFGHGTDNAVDEAAALLFHVLQLDHGAAAAAYEHTPNAADVERVLATFAERIRRRIPAAYLMGHMWFAGLEFAVDPRVIVPRSPFAELIQSGFEPWVDSSGVANILDIGTGSGCIAVACALQFQAAAVDAIDISADALDVARRNVARHAVQDRVRLLEGDVFGPLRDERYDVIVSNPPYVSVAEMTALPQEYGYEPDLALRAGADGLDVVRRILAGAERHLTDQGALFVEVGDSDANLRRAYPTVPFTWLEFEHGGGGVFMITRAELVRQRRVLAAAG
jgi:ribosomal protein L3 glutamine methyltransferase